MLSIRSGMLVLSLSTTTSHRIRMFSLRQMNANHLISSPLPTAWLQILVLCCNNFSFRRDHTTLVSALLLPNIKPAASNRGIAHPIQVELRIVHARDCIVTSTPKSTNAMTTTKTYRRNFPSPDTRIPPHLPTHFSFRSRSARKSRLQTGLWLQKLVKTVFLAK